MGFQHVTHELNTQGNEAKIKALSKILVRYAGDADVIDLRRQMGKKGYEPVGHRWEDDGESGDLADESGEVVLIGGIHPEEFAREIIVAAGGHIEETGERKNYKVVGLRTVQGDGGASDLQEVFSYLLPQTMFDEGTDHVVASNEHHDALMGTFQQLQRQNDKLFANFLILVGKIPDLMVKVTNLIEQLGDQASAAGGNNAEAILKIMEFEAERESRWIAHEQSKSRGHDRAELLAEVIKVAGPDVMVLLKTIVAEIMGSLNRRHEEKPKEPAALATRLDKLLGDLPPETLEKIRAILSQDEWGLVEAARKAPSDDEFKGLFAKLGELFRARPEEEMQRLNKELIDAAGMPVALELLRLIKIATT